MDRDNSHLKRMVVYGALLGLGSLVLEWLDYRHLARSHSTEIYLILVASAFLGLGIFVGIRLFAPPSRPSAEGNPEAQSALGISPRELAVLRELAAGRSNKEIAASLKVSPNTIKTHVTRLFEKLDARRRTEAINKARSLGLLP